MANDIEAAMSRHYGRVKAARARFAQRTRDASKEYNLAIKPHLDRFRGAVEEHELQFKRKYTVARQEYDAAVNSSSARMQRALLEHDIAETGKIDASAVGKIPVCEAVIDLPTPQPAEKKRKAQVKTGDKPCVKS